MYSLLIRAHGFKLPRHSFFVTAIASCHPQKCLSSLPIAVLNHVNILKLLLQYNHNLGLGCRWVRATFPRRSIHCNDLQYFRAVNTQITFPAETDLSLTCKDNQQAVRKPQNRRQTFQTHHNRTRQDGGFKQGQTTLTLIT